MITVCSCFQPHVSGLLIEGFEKGLGTTRAAPGYVRAEDRYDQIMLRCKHDEWVPPDSFEHVLDNDDPILEVWVGRNLDLIFEDYYTEDYEIVSTWRPTKGTIAFSTVEFGDTEEPSTDPGYELHALMSDIVLHDVDGVYYDVPIREWELVGTWYWYDD